jgi:hypothetical protein
VEFCSNPGDFVAVGERCELATDDYVALSPVLEQMVRFHVACVCVSVAASGDFEGESQRAAQDSRAA